MHRLILTFLLIPALWSCEDPVKFEVPQPPGRNDLNQIPKGLRGTYFSTSDSTYIIINQLNMVNWTDRMVKTLVDSIDMEIDSSRIVKQTPEATHVKGDNYNLSFKFFPVDSVLVNYSYWDTLFEISSENVLRRFKGDYFLNYKKGQNNWKVRRLTLDKGGLYFSRVRLPEDIEKLKEITRLQEIKSDSGRVVGYKLNPTRKEFKRLMKRSFSETKTYRKVGHMPHNTSYE